MKVIAESEEDYKGLMLLQNLMGQRLKEEQQIDPDGPLTAVLKKFNNTPIYKSWEFSGEDMKAANSATMDTEEKEYFIPYLVHAAVNKKKVAIEYTSKGKPMSKRIIEPMSWVNAKTGGINIAAWCHSSGQFRQFNPLNMSRVAVLGEGFDREEIPEIKAEDVKLMVQNAGLS